MAVRKFCKSYWVDFSFNSKRFRKRSPDNSFKGTQAYELLLRQRLARGQPLEEPKQETRHYFKDVALQWLDVYVKNNNKPSETTNKRYIVISNLIPYFSSLYIDEISSYKVEQLKSYFLNEKKLSPKTVNNYISILGRCLRSAEEWGILKTIPKIKLLKVPPQKYDYLTESEAQQLLQQAKGQWNEMILLAIRTGLRFGEIIGLKWEDIDLKRAHLTVSRSIVRNIEGSPKNNKTRIVPLAPSVVKMLRDKERTWEYIFHNRKGIPLKHDFCRDNLHEICKQAGLRKIGWHSLRHSFASHLAAKRNSIVAIKELMGHSDIKTTMRYAHVNLPVLQNAIDTLEPAFQENVNRASKIEIRDHEFGFRLTPKLQNSLEKIEKYDDNDYS